MGGNMNLSMNNETQNRLNSHAKRYAMWNVQEHNGLAAESRPNENN